MIWPLYYILIYLMVAGIRISSLWNAKSKNWISGRRHWYKQIRNLPQKKSCRIWFHISSLGEFEQARPVIEKLKERHPATEIVITFFSPSGYLVKSGYALAEVLYLPADLPGNAKKWLDVIQPDMAVFVKYDLWPGFISELQRKTTPVILISAHWIPGGIFHSWSLPPTRSLLKKLNRIFLQSGDAIVYFQNLGFKNLEIAGDTRIDRSLKLPLEAGERVPDVLAATGPYDLVAGSTWPADERLLSDAIVKLNLKVILAPHDVSEENIHRLLHSLPFPVTRLSEMRSATKFEKVILVDSIGLLSVLYTLGKIAYIGGGFGSGIHNTLEAMAHRKPLIFGPAYRKFAEAVAMIEKQGAWEVSSTSDLIKVIHQLEQHGVAEKAGAIAYDYLVRHAGASERVTDYILDSIPCISEE